MPSKTSGTNSAEGKRRQRERNRAAGHVTRSGSSGAFERLAAIERMTLEQVEEMGFELEAEFLGEVTNYQSAKGGGLMITLAVASDYFEELTRAYLASEMGTSRVFVRVWAEPVKGADDGS